MNLMNAAGTCKDHATALLLFDHLATAECVIGSYTPQREEGFPNAYKCTISGTSYNAKRMPNCGLDELLKQLPEFIAYARMTRKILRISLAAPTVEGFMHMLRAITDCAKADIAYIRFEFNLSCPNNKEMFNAYDPGFIERLLSALGQARFEGLYRAIKLSPIPPSMPLFYHTTEALKSVPGAIQEVVACNTYPDAYYPWGGLFNHRDGFAGMGGESLHYIALGMIKVLSEVLLLRNIEITGVGGIRNFEGITRMNLAGAHRFQVGTAFIKDEIAVFDRIGSFSLD